MERISKGRRKRSILRCLRRILPPVLLAVFVMAAVLMLTTPGRANDEESGLIRQQSAQETGGYWVLVKPPEVDQVQDEYKHWEEIKSGQVCATATNSLSEGSFTQQLKWFKSEHCNKYDHYFTAVATWSQPPERITPGKPLTLQANISKATSITSSTSSWFYGYTSFGISTDEPDLGCGGGTGAGKDVCSMVVSSHQEYEKEDCDLEVGAGRSAGQQFALRYCVYGGVNSSGYRYVYEWVPAEEKPADPGPAEVEDSKPEPPKPDPPKADDSGSDTEYGGQSSSDPGSSSSGGSGSILGPLAVLGTLGALGALGVVGVVGAAAAAILAGVLKGGAAAGGAAAVAAGSAVGTVPEVAPDSVDDLLDELLDELDRDIDETEESEEAPEPDPKKKTRRTQDETDPETEALDEVEAPEAETDSMEDVGESEAQAEIEDPGEEPEAETEATDELGEAEVEESGDAPDVESKESGETPQKKQVERKDDEVTIGEPSEGADWGEYMPDFEKEWLTSQINSELEKMKSEGYFIGNITNIKKVLNLTFGQVTNRIRGWNKSMYCQEMALWGTDHLNRIFPNAHVSTIKIARNDEMTHIANRVILEDGKEIIVDYWESLATGEPKIYTPEQWLKKWEKELGEPWWGDWLNHERIGDDQVNIIEHIVKNGEGAIDNFANGNKSKEPIRNWWKSIDQHKRREIQRDLFKTLPEDQKMVKARIMRYFRKW